MKTRFFLLFLVLYAPKVASQAENNNWLFGNKAHLNFDTNNNTVSVLTDNTISDQLYSAGTVSNKVTGELLFTTDGKNVYNKDFVKMTNSQQSIIINNVGYQSGLIVPSIANRNQYYIFTTTVYEGFLYTVVDMQNGLGDIDVNQKGVHILDEFGNTFTTGSRSGAVTVVPNNLGNAYWVLYPVNNKLYTYKIDSNGFDRHPYTFTTLTFAYNVNDVFTALSNIKVSPGYISPNSKRIGIINPGYFGGNNNSEARFYTFNDATGAVNTTNGIVMDGLNIRQFEFSPNNNIVFYSSIVNGTGGNYTSKVYSRDLSINNGPNTELDSLVQSFYMSFQRSPINEIYFYNNANSRYISRFSNQNIYNPTVVANFLDSNPDYPNFYRFFGNMPQPIPKLDCALYEDLKGNNITNNYSYQVSDKITTSGDYIVNANQDITFYANNAIEFKANTHLKSNSKVLAKIQPCPTSGSKMQGVNSINTTTIVPDIKNDLVIAPNPATNFVSVKMVQNSFNKITITSLDGKLVKSQLIENTSEYSLDVSGISQGIYIIAVETNKGEKISTKLIKE